MEELERTFINLFGNVSILSDTDGLAMKIKFIDKLVIRVNNLSTITII